MTALWPSIFPWKRSNRPFAQLLPGLETGHPVTVGQSPTCSFSVSDGREVLFLSPFRAVLGAIHVQVTDRPSPDAPSLTQANNCANGLFILAIFLANIANFGASRVLQTTSGFTGSFRFMVRGLSRFMVRSWEVLGGKWLTV